LGFKVINHSYPFIIEEIQLLLDLFEHHVPDHSSNREVWQYCQDKNKWLNANTLFSNIRNKTLISENVSEVAQAQYLFEECIAKTLFNFAHSDTPYDLDAPYWIIKNALTLAKLIDIPVDNIIEIIA